MRCNHVNAAFSVETGLKHRTAKLEALEEALTEYSIVFKD